MKIRGNTVGIPNPQPNWEQNDPAQADYIRNKPTEYVIIGATQPDRYPALWFHTGDTSSENVMLSLTDETDTEVIASVDDEDYGVANADTSGTPTESTYSFDIEE